MSTHHRLSMNSSFGACSTASVCHSQLPARARARSASREQGMQSSQAHSHGHPCRSSSAPRQRSVASLTVYVHPTAVRLTARVPTRSDKQPRIFPADQRCEPRCCFRCCFLKASSRLRIRSWLATSIAIPRRLSLAALHSCVALSPLWTSLLAPALSLAPISSQRCLPPRARGCTPHRALSNALAFSAVCSRSCSRGRIALSLLP